MGNTTINRFEWLKAVMQSEDLNPGAKLVASAMAVQFANDDTGQLNPSMQTLADYVKASTDTVKRAVKALVNAGWLGRTEGRGRGNRTTYRLVSPGKIIALSRPEKGAKSPQTKGGNAAPLSEKKGANLHGKGGKSAPSYIEQSFEQKGAQSGECPVLTLFMVHAADDAKVSDWNEWLAKNGFPSLQQLPIKGGDSGGPGYRMPRRWVPTTVEDQNMVKRYIRWALGQQEVRYAAQ